MIFWKLSIPASLFKSPVKNLKIRAYKNHENQPGSQWLAKGVIDEPSGRLCNITVARFVSLALQSLKDRMRMVNRKWHILKVVELIIRTVFVEPIDFLGRNLKFTLLATFRASAILDGKNLRFAQFHRWRK